jgi:trehalose 6-phosphate phosphatase
MKDLLHPRHRPALLRFVGESQRILLAFDYDGVLAPLVRDPSGAVMRPETRNLLARLGTRYPVAVVSGRAWRDTHRFVGDIVHTVVGNHGFELGRPLPVPASVVRKVRGWRRDLARSLSGVPGVYFEDKRSTLAVHYGLTRAWRRSEAAVYEAANRLAGTRLVGGKKVLNILPHDFPDKGDAVRALVARLGCNAALYAGDDVTDEDVFELGPPLVFGVHVGDGPSLARWRVPTQERVDELLEVLVAARPARRRSDGQGRLDGRGARDGSARRAVQRARSGRRASRRNGRGRG